MGLDLNMSVLLRDWIARYCITGPLLTLGVQDLNYTPAQLARAFSVPVADQDSTGVALATDMFKLCGIDETLTLDVSDYEGADIIFDLNRSDPPPSQLSRFGCIVNGGTIEHVFHIPNALAAISRMLRPGGVVIHQVPTHNWVDHGFYQISPTLLFDYYGAAGFEILESVGLLFDPDQRLGCQIIPVLPGTFGQGIRGGLGAQALLCLFAARKAPNARDEVVPIQSLYSHDPVRPPPTLRWFGPITMRDGLRTSETTHDEFVLGPFEPDTGLAWYASVPADFPGGDTDSGPTRSQALLFEDNALLGPPHMSHEKIRRHGGGAYSHWNRGVYLSTSDGSDPNRNGRIYIARIPKIVG
jgi:hypothetical protein